VSGIAKWQKPDGLTLFIAQIMENPYKSLRHALTAGKKILINTMLIKMEKELLAIAKSVTNKMVNTDGIQKVYWKNVLLMRASTD